MQLIAFLFIFFLTAIPSLAQEKPSVSKSVAITATVQVQPASELTEKGAAAPIEVHAKQFEFIPGEITVYQGDTVHLKVIADDTTHGFKIKEYQINKVLKKGKWEEIEFVADKAGEFPYACSVFCGSGHKRMKGKLIVLPRVQKP